MSEQQRPEMPDRQRPETSSEGPRHAEPEVGTVRTAPASAPEHAVVGEGFPRYGDEPDEIPPSGSGDSWSAAPHPGYVPDPATTYSGKRLLAGALVGALVLAAGAFYGVRILTGRSSNGFGAAPWTAAVKQDGAVVGGINAQNSGSAPPIVLPGDFTFGTGGAAAGDAVNKAVADCQVATGNSTQLTATAGTTASIGNWAIQATPSIDSLRADAAELNAAVTAKDSAAVASAADALCATFAQIASLPAMPDANGAKAWATSVTAYAAAASNALKGVSGDPGALQTAADDLRLGAEQLDALSARIITAT